MESGLHVEKVGFFILGSIISQINFTVFADLQTSTFLYKPKDFYGSGPGDLHKQIYSLTHGYYNEFNNLLPPSGPSLAALGHSRAKWPSSPHLRQPEPLPEIEHKSDKLKWFF